MKRCVTGENISCVTKEAWAFSRQLERSNLVFRIGIAHYSGKRPAADIYVGVLRRLVCSRHTDVQRGLMVTWCHI